MTEFYVPSTILLSYVQKYSVDDLKSFSTRDAVEFYREFVNSKEEDIRSSCYLSINDLYVYKKLRNKLRHKYLGRDVKICFSLPRDVKIPIVTDENLEYYISVDVEALKELKLRKTRIIDRILISDLLFRLYYYLVQNYPDFESNVKNFNDIINNVDDTTDSIAGKIESLLREHKDADINLRLFNFYYSRLLSGFKEACFPMLSWSRLLKWSIRFIIFSDRRKELGLKDYSEKRIEESRTVFEKEVNAYIERLKTVAAGIKVFSTGADDEYEALIYSMLPLTPLELGKLYNAATRMGLDITELEQTLNRLISEKRIVLRDGHFQRGEKP